MPYIEELRLIIGQRAIIMVGAGMIITDQRGWLLLGLRNDNHTWSIPGGSMEPGEKLEETARRETREETGLEVHEIQLFGVFSGPEFFYIYPNGDQVYNVSIIYETNQFSGTLTEVREHRLFRFFDPDSLPEEISPPVQPILQEWLRRQVSA